LISPYQEVLFQKIHSASVIQNHGFVKEIPSHKCHLSSSVWAVTKAFETKPWQDRHWELWHNNNSPKKPYLSFPLAASAYAPLKPELQQPFDNKKQA
jgi:hypothetical protein